MEPIPLAVRNDKTVHGRQNNLQPRNDLPRPRAVGELHHPLQVQIPRKLMQRKVRRRPRRLLVLGRQPLERPGLRVRPCVRELEAGRAQESCPLRHSLQVLFAIPPIEFLRGNIRAQLDLCRENGLRVAPGPLFVGSYTCVSL